MTRTFLEEWKGEPTDTGAALRLRCDPIELLSLSSRAKEPPPDLAGIGSRW